MIGAPNRPMYAPNGVPVTSRLIRPRRSFLAARTTRQQRKSRSVLAARSSRLGLLGSNAKADPSLPLVPRGSDYSALIFAMTFSIVARSADGVAHGVAGARKFL